MNTSPHVHAADSPADAGPSLLFRLIAVTHFMQVETMARVSQGDRYGKLSVEFAEYLTLLVERDRSPGELAILLGVSKQTCSKTVSELAALDLIKRRVNPQDSRSSLLSLSAKGKRLLKEGIDAANELLGRMAEAIGRQRLARLLDIFETLCVSLDEAAPVHPAFVESSVAARAGSRPTRLSVQIPRLTKLLRRRLSALTSQRGYSDVSPGLAEMLGMIEQEGSPLQRMAASLGVSKQAVAVAATELEQLGYATRETAPEDRRQIIVRVSPRGRRLLRAIAVSVEQVQAEIRAALGEQEYAVLDEATMSFHQEVIAKSDGSASLQARIEELSRALLDELGPIAARTLAQQLMTMTRSKS